MLELKEKMARKEAEANATIKELSAKFETIDAEIVEEREKRWVIVPHLRIYWLQFCMKKTNCTIFCHILF